MVRIIQRGERPAALHGWPLEWTTDPSTQARTLRCAGLELGYLTVLQLEAASPAAPIEVVIDWSAVAEQLRRDLPV